MTEKFCTLLFLRKDDQILLAMKKRGFGANRYNGVGGKIEPDETIEQALIRECQEEINVTPIHFWQVAEHDFIQEESEKPWRMYVHVFFCDEWKGEPVETEEMAPEWVNITNIPYDTMWSDDHLWLPQVLEGHKVVGNFTFDEHDNLLTHQVDIVKQLPHEADTHQQSPMTFQQMADTIYDFMEARDWHHQSPRNLAVSLSLEANELLEHYQWSEQPSSTTDERAAELADILIYAFHYAAMEGIDIPAAIEKKLAKQGEKYPAKSFKGKSETERRASWLDAKLSYNKKGL